VNALVISWIGFGLVGAWLIIQAVRATSDYVRERDKERAASVLKGPMHPWEGPSGAATTAAGLSKQDAIQPKGSFLIQ